RAVKWLAHVPRTNFSQGALYEIGSALSFFQVRNYAEEFRAALQGKKIAPSRETDDGGAGEEAPGEIDIEETGADQIAKLISAKFKGHGLATLVEAILKAQGYTTYLSPEGADGGTDILAGSGPLGFQTPQLCVEVKSGDSPIDRPTVDKLLGAMSKFGAAQGLFVSWAGFKQNVQKELAPSFFRLRLWTQKEFLENLFANYDRLDDELKAELPLKRIWTVAAQD
ncbi:MAG: restriction endonuclease, partial [Chthoniobacterales bacterium]|nr:restriction endonuclease [Chthoniobacterales bacterium]